MLKSGVETLGSDFSVVAVPSGEEAVLEIAMQRFDLLVTDVRLPGISGLEVLRRVRANSKDRRVMRSHAKAVIFRTDMAISLVGMNSPVPATMFRSL